MRRRQFINLGLASLATAIVARRSRPLPDVNNRIRVAVCGLNGRGWDAHVPGFHRDDQNVQVAVLCDPDAGILRRRREEFRRQFGADVEMEQDVRHVLDRQDIDVISIATPNHWHALLTIWACQAGKDVYVEKPGSHNLWEGRKMIEATHKYSRIVQHGVQLRSSHAMQEAVQKLRGGAIGRVYMARAVVFRERRPIAGQLATASIPPELNWDVWQGPAMETPYREYLHPYNWHWDWRYGDGDLGNQGCHQLDMCLWGLGVGLPEEVSAAGGNVLWDDVKQTPEVLSVSYVYPGADKIIEAEVRPWCTNHEEGVFCGNIFYGEDGILVVSGYDKYRIVLGRRRSRKEGRWIRHTGDHFADFLNAVRTREAESLAAPVETAHTSAAMVHLGNIAYRLKQYLRFDPHQEQFTDSTEANSLSTCEYRRPFVVPDVV